MTGRSALALYRDGQVDWFRASDHDRPALEQRLAELKPLL